MPTAAASASISRCSAAWPVIRDRPGADPMRPPRPDLLARRVEQRAALAWRSRRSRRTPRDRAPCSIIGLPPVGGRCLEAVEAALDIGEPVAALGVLALVDDIDPDRALPGDDGRHRGTEPGVVVSGILVEGGQLGQAADVGGGKSCSCCASSLHPLPTIDACRVPCPSGRVGQHWCPGSDAHIPSAADALTRVGAKGGISRIWCGF